jgi:hypothetical protein
MTIVYPELIKQIMTEHYRRQEDEVRRMLGCWVSELEPVLAFKHDETGMHLVGLTIPSPVGTKPPIVVRAWK